MIYYRKTLFGSGSKLTAVQGFFLMRADIQRKPLGFQEVTAPVYRCVSICVTR